VVTIPLGLHESGSAPDSYAYLPSELVDSASPAWQALPVPAGGSVVVLYLRANGRRDTYSARLTRAVSGQQTCSSLRGTLLLEADEEDAITAVEIQGELEIEYLALAAT